MPSSEAWGWYDTSAITGSLFLNPNLDEYEAPYGGGNLGTTIKNAIASISFSKDTGAIGTPQTTVITQNRLDDPSFIPIDIGGLSNQGYEYLKSKAKTTASSGVNYDLYNYIDKVYGLDASNWYENNPTKPHQSNPHIPTPEAPYIPLASNPTPFAGAKDGDQFAFFGGNKNKNTPPKKPTKQTYKGKNDAVRASTGMYPSMTPEIFLQKYGMSWNEYLALP